MQTLLGPPKEEKFFTLMSSFMGVIILAGPKMLPRLVFFFKGRSTLDSVSM